MSDSLYYAIYRRKPWRVRHVGNGWYTLTSLRRAEPAPFGFYYEAMADGDLWPACLVLRKEWALDKYNQVHKEWYENNV